MRIVADENIPLLREYFGAFGEVEAVNGRHMQPAQIKDADVLLVRSVTPVNAALLDGSAVRFVGTCTIGTDHLDVDYLHRRKIAYASAPGCNAGGVVQYVLRALTGLRRDWRGLKVGVIGCGNVGGRLHRTLAKLGVQTVGYDPFLEPRNDLRLAPLDEVLNADVVCVHTPLTQQGPHPTAHMINASVLQRLLPGALLLNAGRGGAVDNQALLAHLEAGADLDVVLDVWEGEPHINAALARRVAVGTPHIAGYSHEGRTNGSLLICRALAEFLAWPTARVQDHLRMVAQTTDSGGARLTVNSLEDALAQTYDLCTDHERLLASVNAESPLGPAFDAQRKHYPERHEPLYYTASLHPGAEAPEALRRDLQAVGFRLAEPV